MLAYKGFNSKLQATMGKGTFRFEQGKTYEESECKCAEKGFHCAENPLDVLDYYRAMDSRFFVVEAEGDINQDGNGSRISCTKMTLKKEIDRIGLAVRGCLYIQRYPDRETFGRYVKRERGECSGKGDFIVARGKHPMAAGVEGAWLFLMQEEKLTNKISAIYPVQIDGKEHRAGRWYEVRRGKVCEKKN